MGDTEVHAATAGKDFATDRTIDRVGVILGVFLGKGDADLHRAAGLDRVEVAEQRLTQRHHADEIIEDRAEIFLGARRIEALAISLAVRRAHAQRGSDQGVGNVQSRGAAVDFGAGDAAHVRHRRIDLKGRLLLGNGHHRTQVFSGQRDLLRGKRGMNIRGPCLAIRDSRRHQAHDLRARLFRRQFGFLNPLRTTACQHQQSDAQHERFA